MNYKKTQRQLNEISNFLDVILKAQVTKAKMNKWDNIKIEQSTK